MWEQHREVNRCSREVSSEWVGKKQELLTKAESLASRLTGCWSADLCVSTWALMMTWRNVHKVQMKNWWLKKWTLIERKAEVQTWTLENVRTNRSSDRQECKAKYKAHEISRKSLTSNLETEWRQDKQTEGINHQCKWQNQDWERKLEHQTLNIQTAENKPSLDFSHLYHCKLRIFHKNTNTGEEACDGDRACSLWTQKKSCWSWTGTVQDQDYESLSALPCYVDSGVGRTEKRIHRRSSRPWKSHELMKF